LCASCSIDCGLFCVVGARRLLRVWVGLAMVVGGFVQVLMVIARGSL
jgi:hypothetical protein